MTLALGRRYGSVLALMTVMTAGGVGVTHAQEASVTPSLGTLGLGVSGAYKFNESFGVSGTISGFGYDPSGTYQGASYDGSATLFTLGATVDYYVNQSNFRISAGARYSADKVDLTFSKYNPYTMVYDSANVKVTPEYDVQPYLGIGYGAEINEKISVDFALGAYYMGAPQIKETWNTAPDPSLQGNIDNFRDKAEDYKFYPVAQIGLSYRF